MLTSRKVIELLDLTPLQPEGGFFRETWKSAELIHASALPDRYSDSRSFGTAIYFLLTAETVSKIHRLPTDEIFHFYLGDPVEILMLFPDGSSDIVILGQKIDESEAVQAVIPQGTWFGARLTNSRENPHGYALMGTTMAPGFEFSDFETGERKYLKEKYPGRSALIEALTDH